jgi:predicted flap endonuclease-1-like 5' DNA nuclease
MIALTWQTLLLLTIAYFVGCIVGCLARKMFGAGAVAGPEPALQAAAPAPLAPPPREVSRAIVAPVPAPVAEAAPPAPRLMPGAAPQKAFRRAGFDTPEDVTPPETAVEEAVEEAPEETPEAPPEPEKTPDVPPPATIAPPISAAAAVAAAVAERMAVPTPPLAPEPVAAAGDDLTRIRAIDAELAAKLNDLGVTGYEDIAAWSSGDVRAISELLGFSGRIERENWIEQAQILARGGATSYATGLASVALRAEPPAAAPSEPERGPEVATRAAFAEPRRPEPVAPVPVPASVNGRDNLQRVGGISAEIEDVLTAHDVTRYSQIAGWTAADVARVEGLLGSSGRISRENWIEQAQILARGGATAYSRAFDERGGPPTPAVVPPAPTAPAPELVAAPEPESVAVTPEPAEPEAVLAVPEPESASQPEPESEPGLEPEPVTALKPEPPPAAAAEPEVSEGRPAERGPDLSGMRSVRSEAFRSPDSIAATLPATPDDLKRIRGIGLLIERKLNAMGVSTYEQIANWTADDVGTVNAKLEFKGRIERENWIEQARILASGGQTDFSRRFERGEV